VLGLGGAEAPSASPSPGVGPDPGDAPADRPARRAALEALRRGEITAAEAVEKIRRA